jgi:benzoyl-CoA reductase subunit BamC
MKDGSRYYPVIAGPFVDAACTSKHFIVIGDQTYDMCALCRASCPEKPFFIEAETGIPLKCDFCGIPPAPSCVRWCNSGALELVED